MTVRKPEDLTLEEVRKQMALYQRLCYHKVKETPEYKNKTRRRIARERRGAGSSLVSMETQY